MIKRFKRLLANWLLKDVVLEELRVRDLRVGNGTVRVRGSYIDLPGLTSDPALAAGRVWFRSDTGEIKHSPDGSTTKALASKPIARADLEYPTEDVPLSYLAIIDKLQFPVTDGSRAQNYSVTTDSFTDKAIEGEAPVMGGGYAAPWAQFIARFVDKSNFYYLVTWGNASTADFRLCKCSAGSFALISAESIDLTSSYWWRMKLQVSGSTLSGFRQDMTTAKISTTDTDFASGGFGIAEFYGEAYIGALGYLSWLRASATKLQPAISVVEVNLIEDSGLLSPDLLKDVKDNKDLLSVTWGAFDYKSAHATMLITITGDNPYQSGAILKQVEHTKSKNLKALKPPKDYAEAVSQYNSLKADFPEWLAGKDNYAYQVLGHEELEPLAVADFYYGELIDHKTHYDQIKRVPDWELRRTTERWMDRLKRISIVTEERDKHLKKLDSVMKRGW